MTEPRVLFMDIETTPLTSYTWGTYKQNVIEVKEEWHILSIAWKWLGARSVQVCALPDFEDYELDTTSDFNVLSVFADHLDEADVVVAHNAAKFDVPKLNARMAYWQMDPPSPYHVVDTLTMARREFSFTSNRLDALCDHLGLGRKMRHQGFDLWKDCMAGDPKAWRTMKRYNRHDVVLLEALYERLRPWAKVPNMALIGDKPDACPKCGAVGEMISRGWRYNQVTKRRQYQCQVCRGYCAGRALVKSDVRHVA